MTIQRVQRSRMRQLFTALVGTLIVLSFVAVPATATHSWGTYHWSRTTADPLTLKVVDNTTSGTTGWTAELTKTIGEWNAGSTPIRLGYTGGNPAIDPNTCGPVVGTIQACNANYGSNGWMGIAQIWVSKSHITQANAKLNDYYFASSRYTNYPDPAATLAADRLLVMCQEIAHAFGLDHQDETFRNSNLGSCMDYTNDPNGGTYNGFDYGPTNEHPNPHDFAQLTNVIYTHLDNASTTGGKKGSNRAEPAGRSEQAIGNNPNEWGQVIASDAQGRPSHYKKNLGDGRAVFTFVIYAENASASAAQAGPGHVHDEAMDTGGHTHEDDHHKKADGKRDGGKQAKKQQGRHGKRGR